MDIFKWFKQRFCKHTFTKRYNHKTEYYEYVCTKCGAVR